MTLCVYPYCASRTESESENYFRIPEDPELRKKWMSAIPRVLNLTKETLAENCFLCSRHFHKSYFELDANGKIVSMKNDAVPSVFFVPSTGDPMGKSVHSDPPRETTENDLPNIQIPYIPPTMSANGLYHKIRQEELKLLIYKEKVKSEEEELKKFQEQLESAEKNNKSEMSEIYTSLMKKMRPIAPKKPQKKRPKTLEEVVVFLRRDHLLSEEALLVLMHLFSDVLVEEKQTPIHKEGIECFAQYIAFYNSEVYENILSQFDIVLPPLSSVRKLLNTNDGDPGWSHGAFCTMKRLSAKYEGSSKLLCSLLVAETSIKRKEEWDGRKMRGYVDCGPQLSGAGFDIDVDGFPVARSALVLMVVPLEPQVLWRVPVGYFFVNRLSSVEKANIIRECILRLHAVGSVILSVTCDVPFSDKTFLSSLGVSFALLPHICPYFVHPADPLLRVHVIFDSCSVLTSVQNMWASSQGFIDVDKRSIHWKFVSELMKLQEAQAGSYIQTFDSPQWTWDSWYMKNRQLAQLFSETTADAIEYCSNVLKLDQFDGCEGTVHFIRIMSRVSKLLKSRRFMKIKTQGQDDVALRSEYLACLDYLFRLQDEKGEPLHSASTGSIHLLYQTLMSCQELLRQVPSFSPHCVCLDELEILFYIIRTYTGWCATPTARQFTTAFTSHIQKNGYIAAWSCARLNHFWWVDAMDVGVARREGRLVSKPELTKFCIPPNFETKISDYHVYDLLDSRSFTSSKFIAICIVKSLADILHCDVCLEALQDTPTSDNPFLMLLRKTCGAVVCPSTDVLKVCACTEHHLLQAIRTAKPRVKLSVFEWSDKHFSNSVCMAVVKDFQEKGMAIFSSLRQHLLDCPPDSSHLYRLLRGISHCYLLMRLRSMKSWCVI